MKPEVDRLLDAAADICARYQIADLSYFLKSCRSFARAGRLNVAVFGRFKAGKSSFLNHLIGQAALPTGAIPVTSVITEIQFGERERGEVRFLDGHCEGIALARIGDFIAESANPGNAKGIAAVRLETPAMERYRDVTFVDTPGLDSVFENNSTVAAEWLPNAGIALVAVAVDPPLSQHDVELIRKLGRFTPNVSVLLTKVDTLPPEERAQVETFVGEQLARLGDGSVAVYPYSVRPGFEHLRAELDRKLLGGGQAGDGQRRAILRHKVELLLDECRGYLQMALAVAETSDGERAQLRLRVVGEKCLLDDARLTPVLLARHASAGMRTMFERLLSRDETGARERLMEAFETRYPDWTSSLGTALARFDEWLREALTKEMADLSRRHRDEFMEPARRASRQISQALQDFRNRLAQQTLDTLGHALKTTQVELAVQEPRAPDVRVGRIFDRNWELLSAIVPMALFEGLVKRHFQRKIEDVVFMNLSRLASQWESAVGATLASLQEDAVVRLHTLISTVETLIASRAEGAPRIREDLARLAALQADRK